METIFHDKQLFNKNLPPLEEENQVAEDDLVLQTAQKNFGVKYLYPWQRMVIENILEAFQFSERGSQIVLLPTGAGKSLCFMVPALLLQGPTLIIYPLLALMADQERRMKAGGIEPVVFRGQQSKEEREDNFRRIRAGSKFILANPEVLQSELLTARLAGCNIAHLAIDEAHCVSEWGDSFRPAYLSLGSIIQKLAVPVVSAFTATASPEVLNRIGQVLFGGSAHIVRSEADRPNLRYYVKWTCAKQKTLIKTIAEAQRPLIVFCSSRKRSQELALVLNEFLQRQGETDSVRFYHAGLSREEKTTVEKWFFPKKDGILTATCAFGMGVDKSDIRTVIHYDPPSTAEAYIQEAGRGGRDGSVSKAILLWSPIDSKKAANFAANSRQRVLVNFAETKTCRRQVLLDALGAEQTVCSGCDICEKTAAGTMQDTQDVLKFIKKNRRLYTIGEAAAALQYEQNLQAAQNWDIRIWEEKDIREIFSVLFEQGLLDKKKNFKQPLIFRHQLYYLLRLVYRQFFLLWRYFRGEQKDA